MWTKDDFAAEMVKRLTTDADRLARSFQSPNGTTTRHLVYDDLLPQEIADEVGGAFPVDCAGFRRRDDFRERKSTSVLLDDHAPILKEITFAFQSPEVIAAVSRITGFSSLEPDPKLYAGGLSIMLRGDYLHPHIDNSHDSERRRYRRLNLLYYVSPNWADANGGNFELWNEARSRPRSASRSRHSGSWRRATGWPAGRRDHAPADATSARPTEPARSVAARSMRCAT